MRILTTIILSCLTVSMVFGQQKDKQTEPDFTNFVNPFQTKVTTLPQVIRPEKSENHSVTKHKNSYFVKFQNAPNAESAATTLTSVLELRQEDKLQEVGTFSDEIGFTHRKFQQFYKGLEVFGGRIVTHEQNNLIKTINGHFYANLKITTRPSISEQAAIAKAMQKIGASEWQWQTENETYYKELTGGTLKPTAVLMIAPANGSFISDAFRLVYKVNINAQKPYGVYDVFVDAATGQVILQLDKIENTDAVGTAQTRYSGTQQITTDNTGSSFRLRQSGRNIETKNMNNGTNFNAAVDFTNATNNWTTSGVALGSITVNVINDDWYTTFNENPSNGGMPDLFIAVFDANSNNVYQSTTFLNTFPPVTFSNINLTIPAGQSYTVQIFDNDNLASAHDFLGQFTVSGSGTGTQNFSNVGTSGTYTKTTGLASPGLDAHWGMEKTYDFFLTKFNRNSYDGSGAKIKSFVHFDNALENAFWDPNLQALVFGDGASTFSPLVSVDVAGHEFSHAVITNTADLIYQGEPGALNESFADIFGVAIEFFAKPATANWDIGDEITLTAPGYLRSMSNPNSGLSPQPDTYGGTHWADPTASFDNGGVHVNSGVQNYWYYLLAVGGSGTNDIGNAFNVVGIGIDDATAIAYRNLSVYLNQSSDYLDAVSGSIQAAQDLFGAGSSQVTAVQNAWYAVGLGNASNSFCSGLTTFTATTDIFSDGSGSSNYQDDSDCSWLIQPAGANQVTLSFNSFDTETSYDSVKVYDGVNANAPLLLEWTGSTIPPAVTSTGGAMFVRFTSDASQTAQGWEATYTSTGMAFCNGGQTLTGQTGSFSDGSGLNNYANNAFCYWNIAPAGASSIVLNFTAFDTEAGYDGVVIYDGETVNDPVLLNASGSTLPSAVTSTGGKMLVVFTSDASVTAAGFEANYTITGGNNYCNTAIIVDDFTVIEDGSGANDYLNNTLCTWLIQPANATGIDLYFTAFDVENASQDGSSIYDAVEIYDGVNDSAPLLARYYGSNIPPVTSSTGGAMFIKFYSDGSIARQGWEAYFVTQTQTFCQGNTVLNNLSGTFSDGSSADDYGNSAECSWSLQASAGNYVLVNFVEFDTEPGFDFVIVYDGADDSAPIIGNYSGNTLPSQISSSNEDLYIVFVSDESVTAGGFLANYAMLLVNSDEVKEQYDLSVFPNPFTNQLNIEFDLEKSEQVTIQLFDVVGRNLRQENLGQLSSGKKQQFINTDDLPKGTYILRLQIGEQVINQKVMKMN